MRDKVDTRESKLFKDSTLARAMNSDLVALLMIAGRRDFRDSAALSARSATPWSVNCRRACDWIMW